MFGTKKSSLEKKVKKPFNKNEKAVRQEGKENGELYAL